MQSKSYSVLVTALFSLFIGGLLLAFLISPKRAVSETENRSLAQAPAFSAEAVLSGEYMKKLEDFVGRRVNGVKQLNNQQMLYAKFDAAAAYYK